MNPALIAKIVRFACEEVSTTALVKGPFPREPLRATSIMLQEASEAHAEALKITAPAGSRSSYRGSVGSREGLRLELIQTIACCAQIIEHIEEEMS